MLQSSGVILIVIWKKAGWIVQAMLDETFWAESSYNIQHHVFKRIKYAFSNSVG